MRPSILPTGSHYAVTWGIPEQPGGMTRALLRRSRAFVRTAGTPVTILTYDADSSYPEVREELRRQGELIDGMNLVNLWEDLRSWTPEQFAAVPSRADPADSFSPLGSRGDTADSFRRTLRDSAGNVTQVDHLREDGSLLVSDRKPVDGRRRTVTLCDRSGSPVATWHRMRDLYHAWLDSLPRSPVAWFIVDSKTSADHFSHYRRPDAVTLHLVHGAHLLPGCPVDGELVSERRQTLSRLEHWDGVVFLTPQQRDDVAQRFGSADRLHVCPNARAAPSREPEFTRPSHRGAIVASLTRRKRVPEAIRGVIAAARSRASGPAPTLDVYGTGRGIHRARWAAWSGLAPHRIAFHGYVTDVPDRLHEASFILLTSQSEGQPLALVEGMSAGCIPISYDIRYGPADLIAHGENGFLVPDGDTEALAECIRFVAGSTSEELEPLRRAAVKRAEELNDDTVTARWGDILRSAHEGKTV